jgi:hypothetical protein
MVRGVISYTDIFEDPHETRFLMVYVPKTDTGGGGWRPSEKGNKAT